ncbi:DnaJ domain-containing protein, putative, partial [Eimeria tenella]
AYEFLSDPKKKDFYDKTGVRPEDAAAAAAAGGAAGAAGGGFEGFDPSMLFTDFADLFASMARGSSSSSSSSGGFGPHSFAAAFGGPTGASRGEDIQTELSLDLMEAIKGCEKRELGLQQLQQQRQRGGPPGGPLLGLRGLGGTEG